MLYEETLISDIQPCERLEHPLDGNVCALQISALLLLLLLSYLVFPSGASASDTELGQFCGSVANPVYSSGFTMRVEFHTDSSVNATGFEATYSTGGSCTIALALIPLGNNFPIIPEYSRIFPNNLKDFLVFLNIFEYFGIFCNILEYSGIL